MHSENRKYSVSAILVYSQLFNGRISRTTFFLRAAVFFAVIIFTGVPFNTYLAPSTKTVRDIYIACSLVVVAICLIGFASAYVKRLHDMGLSGRWALPALIGLPGIVVYLGYAYESYRYELDPLADLAGFQDVVLAGAFLLPILIALKKGQQTENKHGPIPSAVEHLYASKFSVAALVGLAVIILPSSIYAGLFQSGIWIGRGNRPSPSPPMETNVPGMRFIKCWNLKGVGAGSGIGPASGVFRDGYTNNVFDFVVTPSGQIDIAMAGERGGSSYLADGFKIIAYGIPAPKTGSSPINVLAVDRFMLIAVYDQGGARGPINYTAFSFAKRKNGWPNYEVVMTSAMSSSESAIDLGKFPAARGRVMIGDCVAT